jgi:hypothetical protein
LFPTVRNWGSQIHAADGGVRNLVTAPPNPALESDGGPEGRSAVDIWAMLPKWWATSRRDIESVRAKGDELWAYTALVQDSYSPKWEIDFAPVNYRILPGFLSQTMGLTGILYWSVDRWTSSPWTDVYGYKVDGNAYPGEGMLVYPGRPAGLASIVPSMRLKWIREGVQDFEYVAILKRLGREDLARQIVSEVSSDWRTWTHDANSLDRVRRRIGDEIERLSGENAWQTAN